jgi:O-antigen/teichoic acid export membrane protein
MADIAKNTFYLTFASIIQRILAFVFFTIVARSIGVGMTGRYSFALSFALLFSVLADFGLTSVAVREASRTRERISEIFNTVLGAKIVLGLITFGAIFTAINVMGYPPGAKLFVYLAALVMILDSVHLTLYGALRSLFNLRFEAIGLVLGQTVSLSLAAIILIAKLPPSYLFGALAVSSLLNITLASTALKMKYSVVLFPRINRQVFPYLFKIAFQFALAGVFAKVYSYIDMVLLSYLKGEAVAGWYSIPVKLTFSFQFIPMAMVAAVYPAMSYYYSCSYDRLKYTFEKSLIYLAIIALPLTFGTVVLADKIIIALYGSAYTPSIIPLQIMTLSLIFAFLDFPVGSVLNACDRQHLQTSCLGLTMVFNVVLNAIIIPRYSMIGAACVAFLTYIILFFSGMILVRKIVKYQIKHLLWSIFKIASAATAMAFLVNFLEVILPWYVLVVLGMIFYALFLRLFKVVTADDIKYFWNLFRKKEVKAV